MGTRRRRGRRRIALVLVMLVLACAGLMIHDTLFTRLERVELTNPAIAPGRPLRIVQVTDVHDLRGERQLADIVRLVSDARPDLIAVTGDMVNRDTTDFTRMSQLLADLVEVGVPVFIVPGNHEDANVFVRWGNSLLQGSGATLLLDRGTTLDGPWGKLDVMGTDDYHSGYGDLTAAVQSRRPDSFGLLLTHSPEGVIPLLADSSLDLVLCGHTHGGQVRLPGVGALITNGGGFLPEYDKGLFTVGDTTLFIDSGVGTTGPPIRFFSPSQVTLIEVSHP